MGSSRTDKDFMDTSGRKMVSWNCPRTNAKACPELGIEKTSFSAHHKKHIAKVMGHCCVGYLFDGDVESGGEGFLISCDRCAAYKMPL